MCVCVCVCMCMCVCVCVCVWIYMNVYTQFSHFITIGIIIHYYSFHIKHRRAYFWSILCIDIYVYIYTYIYIYICVCVGRGIYMNVYTLFPTSSPLLLLYSYSFCLNKLKALLLEHSLYKKVRLVIYYNKFKTSHLIISNNTSLSTELLDRTNVVYMFKCPLGNCVSKENNAYAGLTTTTLSWWLTMHLNDSCSIALHLKTHSIPKSNFQKVLVENTTIIAHKKNKLRLLILEALHIKTKKP